MPHPILVGGSNPQVQAASMVAIRGGKIYSLLSVLLSMELTVDEKIGIIKSEYDISVNDEIRKDVSEMCNLSQGIRERTVAERDEKIILNMHRKGYTLDQIAECVEKSIEEVEAVIEKRESVLA